MPFVPKNQKTSGKKGKGLKMRTPQRCNEMAEFVTGKISLEFYGGLQVYELLAKILDYLLSPERNFEQQLAAIRPALGNSEANDRYKNITDKMAREFQEINTDEFKAQIDEAMQKFRINEYIDPDIGDAVTTFSVAPDDGQRVPLGYHFGSVVAKSGSDYITLENYARHDAISEDRASNNDPLFYFRMFGNHQSLNRWHEGIGGFVGNKISFVVHK